MREIQNLQSVNLEQLPREVRAHILQTIQDLTGYTRPQTVIGILIKTIGPMPSKIDGSGSSRETELDGNSFVKAVVGVESKDADPWRISIQVSSDQFSVEQESENSDVFTAVSEAKKKMLEVLSKIQSQLPSSNPDAAPPFTVNLKPETIH